MWYSDITCSFNWRCKRAASLLLNLFNKLNKLTKCQERKHSNVYFRGNTTVHRLNSSFSLTDLKRASSPRYLIVIHTLFKLDWDWIKLRTVLVCLHSHLVFGPNKSSVLRVRCENILARQTLPTLSFLSPPAVSSCLWTRGPGLSCVQSQFGAQPCSLAGCQAPVACSDPPVIRA